MPAGCYLTKPTHAMTLVDKSIMADLENVYACSLCDYFASPSFATVLRHIGNTHASDHDLNISCPVRGCPRSYTNFESFRSHVYRKHRSALLGRAKQNVLELSESMSPDGSSTRGMIIVYSILMQFLLGLSYSYIILLTQLY